MIEYIQGINSDRIIINGTPYTFGYDCSYTIKYENYAQENYNNAIKHGWKSMYSLKPFIGRILNEVEPNWYEEEWVGYNVFMGRALTSEELTQIKDNIKKECEKI